MIHLVLEILPWAGVLAMPYFVVAVLVSVRYQGLIDRSPALSLWIVGAWPLWLLPSSKALRERRNQLAIRVDPIRTTELELWCDQHDPLKQWETEQQPKQWDPFMGQPSKCRTCACIYACADHQRWLNQIPQRVISSCNKCPWASQLLYLDDAKAALVLHSRMAHPTEKIPVYSVGVAEPIHEIEVGFHLGITIPFFGPVVGNPMPFSPDPGAM